MSANPDAFQFLRKSAYSHVLKHGNDVQALQRHCREALDVWRREERVDSDINASEAAALVKAVSSWVSQRYHPPKRKPSRRREERAAQAAAAPVFLEYAVEDGLKPSVRNAARISGQSKSTMARHLRMQGIAPVREKKINALPSTVKRLIRLLDSTFPIDGAWLVEVDHCIAKLWDDADTLPEALPRSTRSERRRKLPQLLATINAAGIGFNILVNGDVIAIRRGRRFRGMKAAATWIEDEARINGFKLLRRPEADRRTQRFWDDVWLVDVLTVMFTGAVWRTFVDAQELHPWLRLLRPLLDPRPLNVIIEIAVRRATQDDFVADLRGLCAGVTDREVRKAGYKLANVIETVQLYAERGWDPVDFFADVDQELQFMTYVAEHAPKSYAKLMYFRDIMLPEIAAVHEDDLNPIAATMKKCRSLPDEEKAGTWTAPTAKQLAAFLPPKK